MVGMLNLVSFALALACTLYGTAAAPTAGTFTQKSSFTIPKAPSGMFYDSVSGLLYILCGTSTNGDHYIYAYTTSGTQKCMITIPQASRMSRVDGFYIVGSDAYIVDSQGPIYASTKLGGSVYKVAWSNPCGCSSGGTCTATTASWSPTVTKTWTLDAQQSSINDGGGNDQYFRNSGIAVVGDHFYAVNGVHPNPTLTGSYPKSLVKVTMADSSIAQKWSFDASTIGHDVDMEGITCGSDSCANYIYVGDEYNYIYKLNLATSDPATAVEMQWDINSVVGNVNDDKGIESLTYAPSTGYFYAGIQDTSNIHVLELTGAGSSATVTTAPAEAATEAPTEAPTQAPPAPTGVEHIVTDSTGVKQWSAGAGAYASITAAVNDKITFNFNGGHDVFKMSDSSCGTTGNTELAKTDVGGGVAGTTGLTNKFTYTITAADVTAGSITFACSVPTGSYGHCNAGQKITVNTGPTASAAAAAAAATGTILLMMLMSLYCTVF